MRSKVLLLVGLAVTLTGVFVLGFGMIKIGDTFEPLATLRAPGTATFEVEYSERVTLWHEFETLHEGQVVSHPAELPAGTKFVLLQPSGTEAVASPYRPATQDLESIRRECVGVFEIAEQGRHELRVEGPETRHFSVTNGGNMAGVKELIASVVLGIVLGLVGLGLLAWSLIGFLRRRSQQAAPAE